jgi:hypothetical protein
MNRITVRIPHGGTHMLGVGVAAGTPDCRAREILRRRFGLVVTRAVDQGPFPGTS